MPFRGWFLSSTGLGSGPGSAPRPLCGLCSPGSGGLSQNVLIVAGLPPAGPAESLFKESYYQLMKTALKEDGILCCQGERPPARSSQRC